ncbi:hypothetical protein ZOSMA_13G01220 [Zostera marina]|uniref:Uncharacterized protein n=1 Tax=Zostera marina TaxID=29655 RepID=A0A0K9PYA3_ZOSMR|nr:hypothetical protein ZOSMA_13G01220 [Zostera marina]
MQLIPYKKSMIEVPELPCSSVRIDERRKEKSSTIDCPNDMSPLNPLNEKSSDLEVVMDKCKSVPDPPFVDMNPFSLLGSISLISSLNDKDEDCTIVKCLKKKKDPSSSDKFVFIRTLRSGKIFFSDADDMPRKSKTLPEPSKKKRKVISRKLIIERKNVREMVKLL